jgi:hypothetical protein
VLKLEGGVRDYDLPDIEDASGIDFFEDYRTGGGPSALQPRPASTDENLQKKYQEIQKEMNLLKEEHKSNIRDLDSKIEEQDVQIQLKAQAIKDLTNQLSIKEKDMLKLKEELERSIRTMKDAALLAHQS